jgi:hypothetical protein
MAPKSTEASGTRSSKEIKREKSIGFRLKISKMIGGDRDDIMLVGE